MKIRLAKLLLLPAILTFGYLILTSYPYFFSKITRFDSLGFLSIVEEKSENIEKVGKEGEHLLQGEKNYRQASFHRKQFRHCVGSIRAIISKGIGYCNF